MRIEFIASRGLTFIFEEHEAKVLKFVSDDELNEYLWAEVGRNRRNLLEMLREMIQVPRAPTSTLRPPLTIVEDPSTLRPDGSPAQGALPRAMPGRFQPGTGEAAETRLRQIRRDMKTADEAGRVLLFREQMRIRAGLTDEEKARLAEMLPLIPEEPEHPPEHPTGTKAGE